VVHLPLIGTAYTNTLLRHQDALIVKQGKLHHWAPHASTVLLVFTASKPLQLHAPVVLLARGPTKVRHLQLAIAVNQEKAIRTTILPPNVLHAHQDASPSPREV
jgi:hypothetical protein